MPRPWWVRVGAASAVPPPFALPLLALLALGAALDHRMSLRPVFLVLALAGVVVTFLSATSWVRLGRGAVIWRHLGRIRTVAFREITACATVWGPQGRRRVRVVAIEAGGQLHLLWPTAWIGEPARRALVERITTRRAAAIR